MFENRAHRKISGLGGTRYQGSGEDYIMRSFVICTAHQIFFWCPNKEEGTGQGM